MKTLNEETLIKNLKIKRVVHVQRLSFLLSVVFLFYTTCGETLFTCFCGVKPPIIADMEGANSGSSQCV